nr:hypothetical protein KitaXyl93_77250 [Kitasatospora sp. Xyl93]
MRRAPGRCFAVAPDYAETGGATYTEGFALVPGLAAWPVFEYAWCLRDGAVADLRSPTARRPCTSVSR